MKLSKLLYFADKEHLLTYGRPITGDQYVAMEHGPVPSIGYFLMKHDDRASKENQEVFDDFLRITGNDVIVTATPPQSAFSESDLEVLSETVRKYGAFTAGQLRKVSHKETAWIQAGSNADMDYRAFFDSAESEPIKLVTQEDQFLKDLLESDRLEEAVRESHHECYAV